MAKSQTELTRNYRARLRAKAARVPALQMRIAELEVKLHELTSAIDIERSQKDAPTAVRGNRSVDSRL
jgi:glyceraldehyde-3-phosphate dehydrogenase/erythrose-4-phosphate dehydrogenase